MSNYNNLNHCTWECKYHVGAKHEILRVYNIALKLIE